VRARDGSGAWSAAATALLVVYDPSGGFVTGGGWIVPGGPGSDPGDVLPGLDGVSPANFGFNVRYQKGSSTVPGGALQLDYNAGRLHLKSTAFDWLVVTNTSWAKFQGLATIDGAGGALYPFRVEARDGSPDRLVLRVWAPARTPLRPRRSTRPQATCPAGRSRFTGKGSRRRGVVAAAPLRSTLLLAQPSARPVVSDGRTGNARAS